MIAQVGNPLLDLEISVDHGDFLWSHGAISEETLMLDKTVCNNVRFFREMVHNNLSKECNYSSSKISEEIGTDIDPGSLLLTKCLPSADTRQQFCNTKQVNSEYPTCPFILTRNEFVFIDFNSFLKAPLVTPAFLIR